MRLVSREQLTEDLIYIFDVFQADQILAIIRDRGYVKLMGRLIDGGPEREIMAWILDGGGTYGFVYQDEL